MKLLMFDIDGTLVQACQEDSDCYVQALGQVLGFSKVNTDWGMYQCTSESGIAEELSREMRGRGLSNDESAELEALFTSLIQACSDAAYFQAVPGAIAFLRSLMDSPDFAVALATGGFRRAAELKLKTAGIDFSGVPFATSSEAFERERIMSIALEKALDSNNRDAFDEIIYFGDGTWDAIATHKLGWRMIGIGSNVQQLRELGVQDIFSDFISQEEILDAVRNGKTSTLTSSPQTHTAQPPADTPAPAPPPTPAPAPARQP